MNWYVPKMGYQENFLPAEQKKLGHEVSIITSDRVPEYYRYNKNADKIIGNRIIGSGKFSDNGVDIYRMPRIIEIKSNQQIIFSGLKNKLKELKPDVVHAHNPFWISTFMSVLYSKELNCKVFVDDHSHKNNFHVNTTLKKTYIDFAKKFYIRYMSQISGFIPVTYASKDILINTIGIPEDKIRLLHLGADCNKFKRCDEVRASTRYELGISDDEILVITSGKFSENKDIHYLIKAFDKVLHEYAHVKLLLLGNGSDLYMDWLKDLVNSYHINDNVFFINFVDNDELSKYYNAADIGVWPGDHTITSIEAIATGLPIIVPENDLAYNILFENNAAIGFTRGDISSLSLKIIKLIEDKKLYSVISQNCKNVTKNILSWEEIAKKSILLYEIH